MSARHGLPCHCTFWYDWADISMDLLVVTNLYPPEIHGGYELICSDVVRCLRASGHRVTVLTSGSLPDESNCLRWLQLTRPFDEPPPRWWPAMPCAAAVNRWITGRALRKIRPQGALVFSLRRVGLGPLDELERWGVPTVYVLNDEHLEAFRPASLTAGPRRVARVLLERTVLRWSVDPTRRSFRPVALSRYLAERLMHSGTLPEPARVVPQGIPVERFPCKNAPGRLHVPMRLLYSGRLHRDKGVHTLLEALPILEARGVDVRTTIVGDGSRSYRSRLKQLAQMCKSEVLFTDWVTREQVGEMLRQHDVLVFPSIWSEPFGLSHLEAMASGTVVISTDRGGCLDLIRHGVNALRFEAGDAVDLADQIQTLEADQSLAEALARCSRLEVESSYDVARYSAALVEFLTAWPSAGSVVA